jgi:hypothetical protein
MRPLAGALALCALLAVAATAATAAPLPRLAVLPARGSAPRPRLDTGDRRLAPPPGARAPAEGGAGARALVENGAGAAQNFAYRGGRIMTGTPKVHFIWYGGWAPDAPARDILREMVDGMSGSGYAAILKEYYELDFASGAKTFASGRVRVLRALQAAGSRTPPPLLFASSSSSAAAAAARR